MRKDILLICLIVCSLTLMVIPLSSAIIDVLLAINITLSVLLLMVSIYIKNPSDFSTFPSVILIGTAFRLSLSIGTTRLILSEAEAGDIIETFGEFVVSGSVVIGLVIFLIITVVQFVVVTKGAERVAEVGARFALDALPGKQMSIDAEVRAGTLSSEEAAKRRTILNRDSRFFGAMDGAMKFVKGDAIAGIIIIAINLIGGVAVGVSVHGYSFSEAVSVYSLLTVGDGLVAQIPALLMSLCAGIIVTRTDGDQGQDLGSDIFTELVADPRVPAVGAPIVFGIGLIPGFPILVFGTMAVILIAISFTVRAIAQRQLEAETDDSVPDPNSSTDEPDVDNNTTGAAPIARAQTFKVFIGTKLWANLDTAQTESKLAVLFAQLRHTSGVEFHEPVVTMSETQSDCDLVIEIDEVPVLRETVPVMCVLAIGKKVNKKLPPEVSATPVNWPNIQGSWVPFAHQSELDRLKIRQISAEEAISHLVFREFERNMGVLFTGECVTSFLALAREKYTVEMTEIDQTISSSILVQTLRLLVEDGVPLRPLQLLVTSIQHWITTLDHITPETLAECLRSSMKRQLCYRIAGKDGVLGLALLAPDLEEHAREFLQYNSDTQTHFSGDSTLFEQSIADLVLKQVRNLNSQSASETSQLAIVISSDLRRRFRVFLASNNLHLPVLAPHEIVSDFPSVPLKLIAVSAEKMYSV